MKLDLTPFEKALVSLQKGMARLASAPDDEEVRDACIQRFEFTYELAWKMLRRRLKEDLPSAADLDTMNYRALVRMGAEQGLIDAVEPWFVYRDKRNLTSHTYNAVVAAEVAACLPAFAGHAAQLLERLRQRGQHDA